MQHNLTLAGLFAVILFSVYGCSTPEQQNMLSDQFRRSSEQQPFHAEARRIAE
jgi:hypothetical protein